MSKKSKISWIDRCLIESPLCIGLCLDEKSFTSEMKRLKIKKGARGKWVYDNADATTHFFFSKGKQHHDFCIVSVRKDKKKVYIFGLLVHEAVHIWHALKDDLNEKQPSEEFEAISIQTIAQRLIEKYEREKKR